MKRLLCAALIAGLLAGCAPASGPKIQTIRIGVSLYRSDDTFIALLADHLNSLSADYEQEYGVKLSLEIADAQYNQSLQSDQVTSFLEKGCDVVCVNIVDRTAAAALIDKAETARTPIIFFNREPVEEDLQRWGQAFYVGADAQQSGEMEGSLVVDACAENFAALDRSGDGRLQYVMLEGDPGHQDSLIRTNAAVSTITDAGIPLDKLASGIANWQRAQAAAKTAAWTEKFGDRIELVIANNDDMALGALDTFAATGLPRPAVVGIDGTPAGLTAVADGQMLGTVYHDARAQASGILSLACRLPLGQETRQVQYLSGQYIRVPYLRIDASNVMRYTPPA